MTVKNAPKIILPADVKQKIDHWVDIAPGEISGLGVVEEVADGYRVSRVFLLKQECTGVETELEGQSIADLQCELLDEGNGDQDRLLFWWHSHVKMSTYWSSTDEDCIKACLGSSYWVSVVFNKHKSTRGRVDFKVGERTITLDDLTVRTEPVKQKTSFDNISNALIESLADKEVYLNDFADELFEKLKLKGMLTTSTITDLGFRDFCQSEYDSKVTNLMPVGVEKHDYKSHQHKRDKSNHRDKKKHNRKKGHYEDLNEKTRDETDPYIEYLLKQFEGDFEPSDADLKKMEEDWCNYEKEFS